MHRKSLILASILLAVAAYGKQPKAYQDGKLLQMDSVGCGTDTKDAKKGKTHELLCQEYVVQTDQVLYRIRPKDDRHSTPLAVGQNALFRLEKNKMLLQAEGADSKGREYVIMSIKPRGESTADARPAHLNHLQ
jgi:hypothetical protein